MTEATEPTSALRRWEDFHKFSDQQAALQVGLSVREYCRQRAVGASRQTCLLAILISLYRPDFRKIAATAAALDRPPATCPGNHQPPKRPD